MRLRQLLQKVLFRIRVGANPAGSCRKIWLKMQGVSIGSGTTLSRLEINWPHQLQIGEKCLLESDIAFKFDGSWQPGPSIVIGDGVFVGRDCEFNICERIEIGANGLIGSGCRFIDHNHGVALGTPMNEQPSDNAAIVLEEDVWLGVNVIVLKGVRIGRGAVVGASAVVTKSVGAGEIWAGIPARQIGTRS